MGSKRKIINRSRVFFFLFSSLVIICLYACNSGTIYSEIVDIPIFGWYKNNSAAFNSTIQDTNTANNIFVEIQHSIDYKYSNLWLFIETTSPSKTKITDTLNCILSDDFGNWLGSENRKSVKHKIPFRRNVFFPEKGIYNFEIHHAMRFDTLKSIESIGITIIKL